jgi:phosphate transport system substrate-binding protein
VIRAAAGMLSAAAAAVMLSAAAAPAAAPAQPLETPPMVEWVVPALGTNVPQTAEQAKEGQQSGRKLPPPEVLQPVLDPGLPAFRPRPGKLTGRFKGACSDVLKVLVEKWFEKFKTYHPEVSLTISPPYAGSLGAIELVKGDLDFVFVSRELKPDDMKDFHAKFGYAPLSVPVSGGSYRHFGALDAIAFYVNKDNPLEKITFDQLDAMYSSTHHRGSKPITRWGDLGLTGEWADKPVKLYGIKPWNGFEEFVRQRVLGVGDQRGEWREDITFEKTVFPMAKNIANDRYGIGYSGLAYIDAGVKVLPVIEKADGAALAPTYENVALATYPLSRLTFFNTNKAPGKPLDPALDEFLRFILSREGQQVVLDQASYIPLRENQAHGSRALLDR